MASKHLWIAELQDRDGKTVEYHSLELEEEHYASRADFNRAMTSWSAFRQRERGNLKCNRPKNSRCKWACSWTTPDSITFYVDGVPEMPLHKTIWDLYDAIGYNYKAKKYEREKMTEEKRMRGDVPGMVHIDESGFIDEKGNAIYVATGDGQSTQFLLNERTAPIQEKVGVIATSSTQETATVTERVAMGAGMVAEPASLEEANRLRAKVGLDPLFAQPTEGIRDPGFMVETPQINDPGFAVAPEIAAFAAEGNAPEGIEVTAPHPEGWQEPEYPVIRNPYSGVNITGEQARSIADKVNAEPDVEAKKALLHAELQHYANETARNNHDAKLAKQIKLPGDRRSDPRVIAHKKGVVKAHQKLKRQQAKAEKMKALQLKAFNGK